MRVLKPLTLARRRQLCFRPVPLPPRAGAGAAPLPAESAEIFDLREERRTFADQERQLAAHLPAAE